LSVRDGDTNLAFAAQQNIFNSPSNTSEQLVLQIDRILSLILGKPISLGQMPLSEKIALAADFNIKDHIQDPISTEEELFQKTDLAFWQFEEEIRGGKTKNYIEAVKKLIGVYTLTRSLSQMEDLEAINIDHEALLKRVSESLEQKADVKISNPET
jgi:hypothetical protein